MLSNKQIEDRIRFVGGVGSYFRPLKDDFVEAAASDARNFLSSLPSGYSQPCMSGGLIASRQNLLTFHWTKVTNRNLESISAIMFDDKRWALSVNIKSCTAQHEQLTLDELKKKMRQPAIQGFMSR